MVKKSQETSGLVLGIDATNIRLGGGRTHLIELIHEAEPELFGFSQVVVWGSQETLSLLDDRPWLKKVSSFPHEGCLLFRSAWQAFGLNKALHDHNCDILFVPGGTYISNFHPIVSISQNLLPFDKQAQQNYGWSLMRLKLILLRLTQGHTFDSADGVIFLTKYAKSTVAKNLDNVSFSTIIPLGLNRRFYMPPRKQRPIETYNPDQPFHILYVSSIDFYKNQWCVVEAIAQLRQLIDWPIRLDLIGPSYPAALGRLQDSIQRYDPQGSWVTYHSVIAFEQLHETYHQADLGLFASSCENMPNILLESMAAGLPIACSNRRPMPDILGDAGVYFDPEDPQDITTALKKLIASPELRTQLTSASFVIAQQYTWKDCSNQTFKFIEDVYRKYTQNQVLLT